MAKHTFKTPMHVGDLTNGITVDALHLVSVSINFQPVLDTPKGSPAHIKYWRERVSISCLLQHAETSWTHNVVLAEHTQKGPEAKVMWDKIKAKFPEFEKEILVMLAEHIPEGIVE